MTDTTHNSKHVMHTLKKEIMTEQALEQALSYTDLTENTDSKIGKHAIKSLLDDLITSLASLPANPVPCTQIIRLSPITSVANNFDRLKFPIDNPGRSSTYTRYVTEDTVLRAHVTAMVPPSLDSLSKEQPNDALLVFPGLAYRRDVSDKTHSGVFHQVDIWRITKGKKYTRTDLMQLVNLIFNTLMPGYEPIVYEADHPYTLDGIEVYVDAGGQMIEILEAGLAHPEVLKESGLNPEEYTGLALGAGLDRILMVRKQLPDIRLIRAKDERIQKQMTNLESYTSVSSMPPISRDISYSTMNDYSEEDVSESIRLALGDEVNLLEEVKILNQTSYNDLPDIAKERLGIEPSQKNVLVRVVLRSLDQTLTKEYANNLLDKVYIQINQGKGGYLNT